jgi:hypothetical protein
MAPRKWKNGNELFERRQGGFLQYMVDKFLRQNNTHKTIMKEIPKIITPPVVLTKEIKAKVVVFCDGGDEDWNFFKKEFFWTTYGTITEINFTNLKVFESAKAFDESYQIFMFDWGGMGMGNSMMQHFIRRLYKVAEENPSKDFILLSKFTNEAYNEHLLNSHEKLFNIYTTDQWLETIKK